MKNGSISPSSRIGKVPGERIPDGCPSDHRHTKGQKLSAARFGKALFWYMRSLDNFMDAGLDILQNPSCWGRASCCRHSPVCLFFVFECSQRPWGNWIGYHSHCRSQSHSQHSAILLRLKLENNSIHQNNFPKSPKRTRETRVLA